MSPPLFSARQFAELIGGYNNSHIRGASPSFDYRSRLCDDDRAVWFDTPSIIRLKVVCGDFPGPYALRMIASLSCGHGVRRRRTDVTRSGRPATFRFRARRRRVSEPHPYEPASRAACGGRGRCRDCGRRGPALGCSWACQRRCGRHRARSLGILRCHGHRPRGRRVHRLWLPRRGCRHPRRGAVRRCSRPDRGARAF